MTTSKHRASEWKSLFQIAYSLIEQVNQGGVVIDGWTFGGGTALMLQIGHRESHDVDIFLSDPQHLAYLNPEVRDFDFAIDLADWKSDGHRFTKFVFSDIGEIDFIAAPSLTEQPTNQRQVEGVSILLENVSEIITKKVFYRGEHINPRDIFDIAAAGTKQREEIIVALARYPEKANAALSRMKKLNPEFVKKGISALMILGRFKNVADSAFVDTRNILKSVVSRA